MNRLLIASLDRFGPLRDSVRDDLMTCSQEAARFEPGQVIVPAGARSNTPRRASQAVGEQPLRSTLRAYSSGDCARCA